MSSFFAPAPPAGLPEALPGICWQPIAALPFHGTVRSHSSEVLHATATLFNPWLRPEMKPGALDGRRAEWIVEPELSVVQDDTLPRRWRVPGCTEAEWCGLELSALMTQIEYDAVWRLATDLEAGFIGFHGALLSRDGRGVLVVGRKETGKSTLSCALWQAGWDLLCDDFVVVDSSGCAHASARRVSLRKSARALLEPGLWQSLSALPSSLVTEHVMLFHPHEMRTGAAPNMRPVPLSAVVLLGRSGAETSPVRAEVVPGAHAALSLVAHSSLSWAPSKGAELQLSSNWMQSLSSVAPLVEAVPVFDLARGDLSHMVQAIEDIICPLFA